MTCVNWYSKLEFDENEEDDGDSLGPSIKNIDFKIGLYLNIAAVKKYIFFYNTGQHWG